MSSHETVSIGSQRTETSVSMLMQTWCGLFSSLSTVLKQMKLRIRS